MAASPSSSRMLAAYSSGPALIPKIRGFRASLASVTSSRRVAHASAASLATPAELLTIPIRRPLGNGWRSKNSAASNSSSPPRNRRTPARYNNASTTASPRNAAAV